MKKDNNCQNRKSLMSSAENDLLLVTLTPCSSYIELVVSVGLDFYSGQCCLQDVSEHGYS